MKLWLSLITVWISVLGGTSGMVQTQSFQLPDSLLEKLIMEVGEDAVASKEDWSEPSVLYHLAKSSKNGELTHQVFHILADEAGHVPSQFALGFTYSKSNQQDEALRYFLMAGENGPHQAALYNAGRIYAEREEWVKAMKYIQAAAINFDPPEASKVTSNSLEAFDILSYSVSQIPLSTQQIKEVFLYSNLDNVPAKGSKQREYWTNSMDLLETAEPVNENNKAEWIETMKNLVSALVEVREPEEPDSEQPSGLSPLQEYLLLREQNDILYKILEQEEDDDNALAAAMFSETLAMNIVCYGQAAETREEASSSCFDRSVSMAMRLYKQTGNQEGYDRVSKVLEEHPKAKKEYHDEL